MASPRFVAIESTTASRFLRILPVWEQKVKCVSSARESYQRQRENEEVSAFQAGSHFRHNITSDEDSKYNRIQARMLTTRTNYNFQTSYL